MHVINYLNIFEFMYFLFSLHAVYYCDFYYCIVLWEILLGNPVIEGHAPKILRSHYSEHMYKHYGCVISIPSQSHS